MLTNHQITPSNIDEKSLLTLHQFQNHGKTESEKLLSQLALHAIQDGQLTLRGYSKNDRFNNFSRRFELPGHGDSEIIITSLFNPKGEHNLQAIYLLSLSSGEFKFQSLIKHRESPFSHSFRNEDGRLCPTKDLVPFSVNMMNDSKVTSSNKSYNTKREFIQAITDLVDIDAKDKDVNNGLCYGKSDLKTIEYSWHAYNSAKNIGASLILGRHYQGAIIPACNEIFPCIDQQMIDNFKLTSHASDSQNAGGVFLFHPDTWSPAVNDAFMLGAIHHGQDIFFASHPGKTNIWSESENRLTVTGRELISLKASNRYSFTSSLSSNNLGDVASFNHSHNENFYGFNEYLSSIREHLRTPQLMNTLFNTF